MQTQVMNAQDDSHSIRLAEVSREQSSGLGVKTGSAPVFPGVVVPTSLPVIVSPFQGAMGPFYIHVGPAAEFACIKSRAIPSPPAIRERQAAWPKLPKRMKRLVSECHSVSPAMKYFLGPLSSSLSSAHWLYSLLSSGATCAMAHFTLAQSSLFSY